MTSTIRQGRVVFATVLAIATQALFTIPGAMGAAREAGKARKAVYLVPDLPTFLYYLSAWDGETRFPIFLKRNAFFEKFVRAYKPDAIFKASPRKLENVDSGFLRAAVCAAWGKEKLTDSRQGMSEDRFKYGLRRSFGGPKGIVLTDPNARQLPAALALAAAHGQIVDFLEVSSSVRRLKLSQVMTFEQKEQLRKEVIKIIEHWGYSYESLGDEIDYITLALDLPIAYMGQAPQARGKQRLCLDDGINRLTPDGSLPSPEGNKKEEKTRGHCYAYVGRLLEAEEGMALYQAMCSIFLATDKALYFDRWTEKWGLRAQEGWWVMQTRIPSVLVKKNSSSLARWRRLVGKLNPYGFVHVSSSGNSRQWDDGKVSDIPESVPAIVYFAHSFSAENPYDGTTVAGRWLRSGAYVYLGAMSEPFAQSFNMPRTVAVEAIAGQPLGRAFLTKRLLPERFTFPWKQIYIGDPLHRITFAEDKTESGNSRQFREAVSLVRERKLGQAIEILEDILESVGDEAERERIWWVLEKTFRLRYFAARTGRMPVERHLDVSFVDCWYNDTYYPNGQPTTPVVLDQRLNLFARELVRIYEGLYRTVEERPRLKALLAKRIDELKQNASFVKIWITIGPFTELEDASTENPFRPDKTLRLGESWQVGAGKAGWQAAMVNPADNVLDIGGLYEKPGSIAYAGCFPVLTRAAAADVRLSISTTVMAEVWLNNSLVGSVSGESGEGILDMKLKPGENLLFFKVLRDGNQCVLSAKLADRNGGYLEDVGYADALARLSAAGVKIDRERWQP